MSLRVVSLLLLLAYAHAEDAAEATTVAAVPAEQQQVLYYLPSPFFPYGLAAPSSQFVLSSANSLSLASPQTTVVQGPSAVVQTPSGVVLINSDQSGKSQVFQQEFKSEFGNTQIAVIQAGNGQDEKQSIVQK